MNGDGESCNDTIAHLPTDLESTQGFVSAAAVEEAPSASPPADETSAHEVSKEQIGDESVTIAHEEAAAESEVVVDPEDKLPEDISVQSVAADVSEEEANGQGEVESEKVEISDMWNNGLPNGNTTGWASAEAPGGESNGVAAEGGSASSSGVLGSGPGPAAPTAEQPVQQRYTYYMIRIPRPVDDKGKADITKAEMKLQAKADERDQHSVHVQEAKRKRNEAFEKRQAAREVERQSLKKLKAKFEELKPLRDGLKKLKDASMRDRSQGGVPRSEEELDSRIGALEWRIQHESIPLKEEKQLMRDIKALESSRESVRQSAARNVQVQESVGTREEIEEALKPLNADYKQLEAEFKAAGAKLKAAEEEYEKLNEALTGVMGHYYKANDVRQEAYEARRLLKQQEYGRLKEFYDNKREIQQAKDMASQPKSRQAVEEYCNAQVERVMELWIQNDEFRKTYVKDNERSTVRRLETLDGRALGPDEKPLKLSFYDNPVPSNVPERAQSKPSATENGHGEEAEEAAAEKKEKPALTKESKKESKEASKVFPADADVAVAVVPKKSSEEVEREAAELKEKRRAAEMVKAKEAEERKKRIAERAQVKAQAWAQKEAERKEKEREKRARKKAGPASSAEAPVEAEASPAVESSESGPEVEEAVAEVKKMSSKQRRRGMTSSQKGVEKIPLPPVRRGRKKMFGLSMVSLVGMSAVAVILVAIAIFMLYSGNSGQRAQSQRGK